MFADDTKVYTIGDTSQRFHPVQENLKMLDDWSNIWLLKFNPGKCKQLIIKQREGVEVGVRVMHDNERPDIRIERVEKENDLGILTDNKLNFDQHIGEITRKANRMMGIIRRTFKHLDKDTFLPLYKSMVRSHLEYGQAVWNPHLKKHIQKIETVQRHATKRVEGIKDLSYTERLKYLGLPTLLYRRSRGDMIETYTSMYNIYDPECTPVLVKAEGITRGHDLKLYKRRTQSLELRRHFFTNRIVDNWNSLPEDVVKANSLNSFKNKLDVFWRNKWYNTEKIW